MTNRPKDFLSLELLDHGAIYMGGVLPAAEEPTLVDQFGAPFTKPADPYNVTRDLVTFWDASSLATDDDFLSSYLRMQNQLERQVIELKQLGASLARITHEPANAVRPIVIKSVQQIATTWGSILEDVRFATAEAHLYAFPITFETVTPNVTVPTETWTLAEISEAVALKPIDSEASHLTTAKNSLREWFQLDSWGALADLLKLARQTLDSLDDDSRRPQRQTIAKVLDLYALLRAFLSDSFEERVKWLRGAGKDILIRAGREALELEVERQLMEHLEPQPPSFAVDRSEGETLKPLRRLGGRPPLAERL